MSKYTPVEMFLNILSNRYILVSMRSSLIETFQYDIAYSIDVVARILHINDMNRLQKHCRELIEEGILKYTNSKDTFQLTSFGNDVQKQRIQNDKKLCTKIEVQKLMYKEFEYKLERLKSIEHKVLAFMKVPANNYTTIYHILHFLERTRSIDEKNPPYSICFLHSVIYRLLLYKQLQQCGPILFLI